jgi:CheY-like chemotaxis protein
MGLVESSRPVVLIVEDEYLLRMDAVDMIAAAGFEVVDAANADDAIDILEARRDITVVFTDIQMPGSMDGLKLAAPSGAAGRRSRSSRPLAASPSAQWICPKADGFCPSPTARCR